MTVTLTQDNVLGRIRVDANALAAADYATIERSVDQITWTMCRGASRWEVSGGAFVTPFDDYEFPDGVIVYYRVRGHEDDTPTVINAGSTATGNNASIVPGLPAAMNVHDLMVCFASIRNSGTGTVNTPAGWTLMRAFGNIALLGRYYVSGDSAPTITFTGGVANADTLARILAIRSAKLEPVTGADLLNSSAQNAAAPALAIPEDDMFLLDVVWKQDDATAIGNRTGSGTWTAVGSPLSTTTGDDASQHWMWKVQTDKFDLAADSHVITGGGAAISRSMTIALEHAEYLNEQIEDITPALTGVWMKSLRRPFLNREVQVLDFTDISRESRNVAFPVVGRTYPIGVADVMGGRSWGMTLWTDTLSDADDLDLVLASGDIWFVHVPINCPVPGGYVIIDGNVVRRRSGNAKRGALRRFFDLPLTEVAAPDDDVAGTTGTWATVLANYATWADVLADNATWADLLELIGSPNEVIVA